MHMDKYSLGPRLGRGGFRFIRSFILPFTTYVADLAIKIAERLASKNEQIVPLLLGYARSRAQVRTPECYSYIWFTV